MGTPRIRTQTTSKIQNLGMEKEEKKNKKKESILPLFEITKWCVCVCVVQVYCFAFLGVLNGS